MHNKIALKNVNVYFVEQFSLENTYIAIIFYSN
jgi:hypothetical protein